MSKNRRFVEFGNQKSRVLNMPVIIAVFMMCMMGSILLHSWSQNNSLVPAIQILLGTAQGPSGVVLTHGDVTIYIPPNATEQQGTIFIAEAQPDVSLISNDTHWIRPKVVSVEFRKPNGAPVSDIVFSESLEICFTLLEEQWQSFLTQPDAFDVQHYVNAADSTRWETLPQATYPERLQLCGQTDRLSTFALAIKVDAEVPITGPTATATPTLAPTRTPISSTQTRDPNRRNDPTAGASLINPTGVQPANPQPTNDIPTLQPTRTNTPFPTQTNPPALTNTPRPTRTPTPRPTITNTPRPTNTSQVTNTPRPTNTPQPTATNPPPATSTKPPPTATNPPPTATDPPPPTATDPPPPTATDPPPTDPPTEPPTEEPTEPPTEPPTEEPTEPPTEPPTP